MCCGEATVPRGEGKRGAAGAGGPVSRLARRGVHPILARMTGVAGGTADELLREARDRAERQSNALRGCVLVVLAIAAAAYAPALPARVTLVNVVVLAPMMAWTVAQYLLFYRRDRLPEWLSVANPLADVAAITTTMAGYGLAASPALALKSPLIIAYLAVLAARPITSSVRRAALIAATVVLAYVALDLLLVGRATHTDPVRASVSAGISLLDEAVKVVLLAMAGAIATYATLWSERLTRRSADDAREREALREKLIAAQLDRLRQQLHPHFLFNTLNVIAAVVHTDPAAAERMIAGLGELMRMALYGGAEQEVPLTRELTVLRHYLTIQEIRFEDRIRIETRVADGVGDALVPALILQPLVENAIKHGLAPRASGGRILVAAVRVGDDLELLVQDDGVGSGTPDGAPERERIGLGNARERLRYLYGERCSFVAESPREGGFIVRVRIPFRTYAPPADPGGGRERRDARSGERAA